MALKHIAEAAERKEAQHLNKQIIGSSMRRSSGVARHDAAYIRRWYDHLCPAAVQRRARELEAAQRAQREAAEAARREAGGAVPSLDVERAAQFDLPAKGESLEAWMSRLQKDTRSIMRLLRHAHSEEARGELSSAEKAAWDGMRSSLKESFTRASTFLKGAEGAAPLPRARTTERTTPRRRRRQSASGVTSRA